MPAGWDDPTFLVADLELDGDVEGGFATDDVGYEVGFGQENYPLRHDKHHDSLWRAFRLASNSASVKAPSAMPCG